MNHKWWCSLKDPHYTGECDCDAEYEEELKQEVKEAKEKLIKKAHKRFKQEGR